MQVRQLMAGKSVLVAGVAVVAAAVAVALAAAFWPGDESEAGAAIQVIEDVDGKTKTTEFDTPGKAVAYASDKAGFDFTTPAAVPEGFDLVGISIPPRNPMAPELGPRRVILKFLGNDEGFSVRLVNQRFHFAAQDEDHRVPSRVGELYLQRMERGTVYTLLTADRGYQLNMGNPPELDEAAATALLESFED